MISTKGWSLEAKIAFYTEYDIPTRCWIWQGSTNGTGYARLHHQGKLVYINRILLKAPKHLATLHSCDNPRCVNPRHLRLGTQKENMLDCHRRGRRNQAKGEQINQAKLTAQQVRAIRADTRIARLIAPLYGVNPRTINQIKSGATWTHV